MRLSEVEEGGEYVTGSRSRRGNSVYSLKKYDKKKYTVVEIKPDDELLRELIDSYHHRRPSKKNGTPLLVKNEDKDYRVMSTAELAAEWEEYHEARQEYLEKEEQRNEEFEQKKAELFEAADPLSEAIDLEHSEGSSNKPMQLRTVERKRRAYLRVPSYKMDEFQEALEETAGREFPFLELTPSNTDLSLNAEEIHRIIDLLE